MLDLFTEQEFQERFAAWMISGAGDYRQYAAAILAELHNVIPRYAQSKTSRTIPESSYRSMWDFTPPLYRDDEPPDKFRVYADDPDAAEKIASRV